MFILQDAVECSCQEQPMCRYSSEILSSGLVLLFEHPNNIHIMKLLFIELKLTKLRETDECEPNNLHAHPLTGHQLKNCASYVWNCNCRKAVNDTINGKGVELFLQHSLGSAQKHHDKPVNSMKFDCNVWSHIWVMKHHWWCPLGAWCWNIRQRGELIFFLNLPNPSGRTRPWGSLSL
jgi:hypothetical protein